jgi:ubiquinone/menaquinone biosynthesis C-methylase UbiE
MTVNIQGKSGLARLLAIENLNVIHDPKAVTAAFDLKSRTIVLPILKQMSGYVYDWFIAHEISHALFTPPDEYLKLADETHPIIANICEDARIEKLIKRKYPGTRKDCFAFYKRFSSDEEDFFGIKDVEDLTKLTTSDRLNLHFKIGYFREIPFRDEEKRFITGLTKAETFQDIDKIARELFEFMKQDGQVVEVSVTKLGITNEGESSDGIEIKTSENHLGMGYTQKSFDENFQKNALIDQEISDEVIYGDIYKFSDKDFNNVLKPLDKHALLEDDRARYDSLIRTITPIVGMMVNEFNMRKAAKDYQRTLTSNSGRINPKKISQYKTKDDIFKRNEVIPAAKNHGMVIFIDWSGSMMSHLSATFKQLIVLMEFCKRVQIPFMVYGFTDSTKTGIQITSDLISGDNANLVMFELFNSKDNIKSFRDKSSKFLYSVESNRPKNIFYMTGTPLNNAAFHVETAIKRFQRSRNVEKTSFILLSDGEPTDKLIKNNKKIIKEKIIMRDTNTYKNYSISNPNIAFHTILEYVKETCNIHKNIGFYLTDYLNNYGIELIAPHIQKEEHEKLIKKFNENKFVSMEKSKAFDQYFAISVNNFDVNNNFNPQQIKNRVKSLIFLKKFIEEIA